MLKVMNGATHKQVGDSSLLRGYKRCSMKHRCAEMLSLVVMSQLHLFENEAAIFFFGQVKIYRGKPKLVAILSCHANRSC